MRSFVAGLTSFSHDVLAPEVHVGIFGDPIQPPLFVQHLAWTLLHSLWIILAIGAVFFIANRMTRRAKLQYALGCLSLALIALSLPVTFWILSRVSSNGVGSLDILVSEGLPATSASLADPSLQTRLTATVDWLVPWIILVWSVGMTLMALYHLMGWVRFQIVLRETSRPMPRHFLRLLRKTKKLRLLRPVRLIESACVEVPATVGWLKPIVLIPIGTLTGLSSEHLEAIILHELAHIRRHDYAINIIQTALETTLFYHPVVWWISSNVRASREACCDDIAASELGSTHRYLHALMALEELRMEPPPFVLAVTGGSLLARAGRLLGDPTLHLYGRGRAALGAALLSLFLLALVGSSLFANTRQVSELRMLEHTSSLASVVQNVFEVHGTNSPFELLEPAVEQLHDQPVHEPPALGLFAKRIAMGVDSDALSAAVYAHVNITAPLEFQQSLCWRYGTPKDHLRLVMLLWQRAKRLRFSAPAEAEEAARAAVLFAAQCSYSMGSALAEAVCREPHFQETARITSLQLMQLRQLYADYTQVTAEFSKQTIHLLSEATITDPSLRRLIDLSRQRPDLQVRLVRVLQSLPQSGRGHVISIIQESANDQSLLTRWMETTSSAREPRQRKAVIGTSELLSHIRRYPTSRRVTP